MFRALVNPRTRLLVVEDVIPWWIMRIPTVRRFWWSWRSRPIRNWMLQQIVKLSVPQFVTEETLFYVDSDVFFVNPFDPATIFRDGKAPLFCETGQTGVIPLNDEWHALAAKLLGLPPEPTYDTNFIGNIICWRRSVATSLTSHIERVSGVHWVRAIARNWRLSEYILYGLYATRLSADASASQYNDSTERTHCYWMTKPMSDEDLARFREGLSPPKLATMISAKSCTDVRAIRKAFGY
jgi:hypothetical protein